MNARTCLAFVLGILTSISLAAISPHTAVAQMYSVVDLGTLGGTNSRAYAVNELGQVVGDSDGYAFLWTNGVLAKLSVPSGFKSTFALAVNDSGVIAGAAENSLNRVDAIIWYPDGSLTNLTALSGAGFALANGINNDGQVVGEWFFSSFLAFSWQNGVLSVFGNAGADCQANHVNSLGQVVGHYNNAAFIWLPGGSTNFLAGCLPNPNGQSNVGYAINDSGDTVGNCALGAVLWKDGQEPISLNPNPTNGIAFSINNLGYVVGITAGTNGTYPFLWDCGSGLRDLNTLISTNSGWKLIDARCINDQGQIAGQGILNGHTNAVLLNPIGDIVPVDTTPPLITCPADVVTQTAPGETSVAVSFSTPIATDYCSLVTVVCAPLPGTSFPVGTNIVTCTATDASNNTNSCQFTVTVVATPKPPPVVVGAMSLVTAKCKVKNGISNCAVRGALSVTPSGAVNAPDSLIRFFLSSDTSFDGEGTDTLLHDKKGNTYLHTGIIKAGKIKKLNLSAVLSQDPAASYVIATDTNGNVIASSIVVPK